MSDDNAFEDVWNLLSDHHNGPLIILPSPEMKRAIGDDNEHRWLPDYLSAFLGSPDTSVNTDGVYTRVWTDERIAAEQPPEPIRAKAVEWNTEWKHKPIDPIGTDADFSIQPTGGFTLSFDLTDYGRAWIDSLIYGMSSDDTQRIGRLLLDYAANYDKPRRSRRAARRRLSKRRGKK